MCFSYGFVEYIGRKEAQQAAGRNKNLVLENGKIEVKLYPQVPNSLTEDKASKLLLELIKYSIYIYNIYMFLSTELMYLYFYHIFWFVDKLPVPFTELVMPDYERIKLAQQFHLTTLDLNKAKGGPVNKTQEQKLRKVS